VLHAISSDSLFEYLLHKLVRKHCWIFSGNFFGGMLFFEALLHRMEKFEIKQICLHLICNTSMKGTFLKKTQKNHRITKDVQK